MNQTQYLEMMVRARDMIDELEGLTDDEKGLAFSALDAFLRGDAERLGEVLAPLGEEDRVGVVRTVQAVIENLRLDSENEIVQEGDTAKLEALAGLVETEDKALAAAIDEVFGKTEQSSAPAQVVSV